MEVQPHPEVDFLIQIETGLRVEILHILRLAKSEFEPKLRVSEALDTA